MQEPVSFGEYVRRLRRAKRWSLHALEEATGLSYGHLSRLENDSVTAGADAVARLAEALEGDLGEMLALADCLPRAILDRIVARGGYAEGLKRSAGRAEGLTAPSDPVGALVVDLALQHAIPTAEAYRIAAAIGDLVALRTDQREPLLAIIEGMAANHAHE